MLKVGQLIGFGAGRKLPEITYEYTATYSDSVDRTTYNSNLLNLGTAKSTRIIACFVVARWGSGVPNINSVTIGGVSATRRAEANSSSSSGGWTTMEIWTAAVPTGSTGQVSVALSAQAARMALALYAIYDAQSEVPVATLLKNGSATLDFTQSVESGDVILAGVQGSSTAPSASWTGLTENVDSVIGSENNTFTSASFQAIDHEDPRTMSVTLSGASATSIAGVMGVWR